MVADIEHYVVYDKTVPAIPEVELHAERTVITFGDDGYCSIEKHQPDTKKRVRVGLTPDMVHAIVEAHKQHSPYFGRSPNP